MLEFNIRSEHHINALLFGKEVKEEVRIENGTFKGGKTPGAIKYKNVVQLKKIKGFELDPIGEQNGKGLYSVDEGTLKKLKEKTKNPDAQRVIDLILDIRGLEKLLSTYYDGIEEVTYEDNCVHQQYKHVHMPTARTSCTSPNVQNVIKPPALPTQHFISRFVSGCILVADYKSLEPRVEGELCQDNNLIRDLNNDVDMHIKHLSFAERLPYDEVNELVSNHETWKKKRSRIKPFTFSNQFLAGINTLVRNSGLPADEIEVIINARKEEYPELYSWHDTNFEEVESTGQYSNMLGQVFKFKKYPPKYSWQKEARYSPNEQSNYKTQGTAASICLIMIGKFWREKALHNRDKYLMINTVHDNLMLDCKSEYKEIAKNDLNILTKWKEECKIRFRYDWTVNIEIDVSEGSSWYECI